MSPNAPIPQKVLGFCTRGCRDWGGPGGEATLAGFGVSPNAPIPQRVLGFCTRSTFFKEVEKGLIPSELAEGRQKGARKGYYTDNLFSFFKFLYGGTGESQSTNRSCAIYCDRATNNIHRSCAIYCTRVTNKDDRYNKLCIYGCS